MSEFEDDIIEDDLDYEVELDDLNEAEEEALLAGNEFLPVPENAGFHPSFDEQPVETLENTEVTKTYDQQAGNIIENQDAANIPLQPWKNEELQDEDDSTIMEEEPEASEFDEEEEVEDDEEERRGDRDRFKSERKISLRGLKTQRNIPDTLDKVQTEENPKDPKKQKFQRMKQRNRPQMRPNFPVRPVRPPLMMRPPMPQSPWLPHMAPRPQIPGGGMMPFWSDGPFHDERFQQPIMPPLDWAPGISPRRLGPSVHQRLSPANPQKQPKKRPLQESKNPAANPTKKHQPNEKQGFEQMQGAKPIIAVKPQQLVSKNNTGNPNLKTIETDASMTTATKVTETKQAVKPISSSAEKSVAPPTETEQELTEEELEYRKKMEDQKKKREEIIARKEERRKAAAALAGPLAAQDPSEETPSAPLQKVVVSQSQKMAVPQVKKMTPQPQKVLPFQSQKVATLQPQNMSTPRVKIGAQGKNLKVKRLKRPGAFKQATFTHRQISPQNFSQQRPFQPQVNTAMPPPNFQRPPPLVSAPQFVSPERPPIQPQGIFNVPPPLNLLPPTSVPLLRPPPSLPPMLSNLPPPVLPHQMPLSHIPPPDLQRRPPPSVQSFINVPPPTHNTNNFNNQMFPKQNPQNSFVVEHPQQLLPQGFPPPQNVQPIRKDLKSRLGTHPNTSKSHRESFLTPVPQQPPRKPMPYQHNQNPNNQRVKKFKRVTRRRKNGDVILVKQVLLDDAGNPTGKEMVEFVNEELLTDAERATYIPSSKNVLKTATKIINSPRKAPPHRGPIMRNNPPPHNGGFMQEPPEQPFQNRVAKPHLMPYEEESSVHRHDFHVERPPPIERRVVRTVPLTKRFEQNPRDNLRSVLLSNLPATITVPEIRRTIRSSGFDMPLEVQYDRLSHTCQIDFTNPNVAREFSNKMDGHVLKLSIIKAHRI